MMVETGTGAGKLGTETLPAIRRDKNNNPRPSVGLVERPMTRMRDIVSLDPRLLVLSPYVQYHRIHRPYLQNSYQSIAEFRANSQSPLPFCQLTMIVSLH
jgi:hypothetical protein